MKYPDRARFQPTVVTMTTPTLHLGPAFEALGVPVTGLATRGPADWRGGLLSLLREIRRQRPDLVHTHLRISNVHARVGAFLSGVGPVLTSLHHRDYTFWPPRRIRSRLWKLVDRVTARWFNAVRAATVTV